MSQESSHNHSENCIFCKIAAKEIPANPSRGWMTIPRELSLVTINGAITLMQNPINEISHYLDWLNLN